jgi:hypothetical protein
MLHGEVRHKYGRVEGTERIAEIGERECREENRTRGRERGAPDQAQRTQIPPRPLLCEILPRVGAGRLCGDRVTVSGGGGCAAPAPEVAEEVHYIV